MLQALMAKIRSVKMLLTSPGHEGALEIHLRRLRRRRDVDRIDDAWFATTFRSYRRGDTILNNIVQLCAGVRARRF